MKERYWSDYAGKPTQGMVGFRSYSSEGPIEHIEYPSSTEPVSLVVGSLQTGHLGLQATEVVQVSQMTQLCCCTTGVSPPFRL